jgi:hypothetical protein
MNNLVTVVVSTRKKDETYHNHLKKVFSNPKTQILIYENDGTMSLPEVYNKGLDESVNDVVVFMHDDLHIETKNIGEKICRLFNKNPEFGILGIAGTTDLVNGKWWEIRKSMHGKVNHENNGKKWTSKYSTESYSEKPKEVVCVDGLFMMVHKKRITQRFDEDFKGFHFYDISFCVSNYTNGVKIGVTTKFDVTHKSVGETNLQWEENKLQFEDKFKDVLPLKLTNNKSYEDRLNYSKESIGLGIVTYNSEDRIKQSAITVPSWIKNFVIVNDGTPYDETSYPPNAHVIQHETNKSVGGAKNSAIDYLLNQGCEHIFIMEDDVLIKDENVFNKYIETSLYTGIKHLNYALQGPANRKGAQGFETLEERSKQDVTGDPNPREIVKYTEEIEVSLYPNSVGAFSYYQREVLEKIGGFDVKYVNAWEHVDHTLSAYKNGFTTPYWWFADINKSWEYLTDIENCIENSTIAKSDTWKENNRTGFIHFKQKHGFNPIEIPDTSKENLHKVLTNLYQFR